ncbi:MAG: 2,3-bisphosphoglycerate-independent phosphoglycerate mutase, partial [Mycoplasmatales bacterium]
INSEIAQKICDNDSVVFANFRPDRATQLGGVLTNPDYDPKPEDPIFSPTYRPTNLTFIQMMSYGPDVIGDIAYSLPKLVNTFGEVVAAAGLNQVRIAETEKYPHVTFFFDGGVDMELPGASRILVNSPKVATYDLQPEMSAPEVGDKLMASLEEGNTDVYILNFANADMVGHSGMLEPATKAVEAVDLQLGRIVDKVLELSGVAIITADHGNAEVVTNDDESPNTAHTTNHVPLIITKTGIEIGHEGALCDIAPTLLSLLNVKQPKEMTGKSLIKWEI